MPWSRNISTEKKTKREKMKVDSGAQLETRTGELVELNSEETEN